MDFVLHFEEQKYPVSSLAGCVLQHPLLAGSRVALQPWKVSALLGKVKVTDYIYILNGKSKWEWNGWEKQNYLSLSQQPWACLQDRRGVKFVSHGQLIRLCGKWNHTIAFSHAQKQTQNSHLQYVVKPQCWRYKGESNPVGANKSTSLCLPQWCSHSFQSLTTMFPRGHSMGLLAVILEGGEQ